MNKEKQLKQMEFPFFESDKGKKLVSVYIDIQNLWFRYRKLQWQELRKWIESKWEINKIVAYLSLDMGNKKQLDFCTFLSTNGYKVKTIDIKINTNVDSYIIHDLTKEYLTTLYNYKELEFLLLSGDNDFSYILDECNKTGFNVNVLGCKGNVGDELLKVSNVFYIEDIPGVL